MASKYDKDYEAYQREVQSYLKKVKGGRRVPAVDPQDPKFSQHADDERQARRAGLGSHIKFGPPAPAFNDTAPPPAGSINAASTAQPAPSPGMYNQFVDFLDRTRGALTRQFSNRSAAPSPVWGFHEPTLNAAEGAGKAAEGAMDVMADPRNAWIGLGPMGVLGKMGGMFRKAVPDAGGFHVPTSKMVKDDPYMAGPSHNLWEEEKRQDYLFGRQLENDMVGKMLSGPSGHAEAMERYKQLGAGEQENVNRVYLGRQGLQDEIENAMGGKLGGAIPNRWLFDRGNGNPRR